MWYNNGDMSDPNEQVAVYEYDGLFRRIEKVVGNQGTGIVHGSERPDDPNDPDLTGIQAGNRHEHYYYTGWRLLETRDGSDDTLGQFVYGTQYLDEPLRYDRNTDVDSDNDCLESAGSRAYYYHQDANYRVVMLTDEDGAVVERYRYNGLRRADRLRRFRWQRRRTDQRRLRQCGRQPTDAPGSLPRRRDGPELQPLPHSPHPPGPIHAA